MATALSRTPEKAGRSYRVGPRLGKALLIAAMVFLALLTIFPIYWVFVLATHSSSEIFTSPPPLWFGDNLLENHDILTNNVPFWRSVWNSVYISLMAMITTLFFCSIGGFGFAMYEFRFKNFLFGFVLVTLMIPAILNVIPYFVIIKIFGWIDTPRALWVPGMANAFGIFLMRQFIASSMPKNLMDAARIDGASEFRIYWSVVLPLIRPAIGTLGLLTFITNWNSFLIPLVILKQDITYTIPVTLRNLQGTYLTDWGAIMLGAALAILPLLIIFFIASKQVIEGLTQGAVKG